MNQSVFLEPAGSSGSPVEPPVRTVQPRFDLNPVQMIGSDRNGDRLTVGPVRPAGPVRFLKHCVLLSGISIVSSLSFHGDQSKAATFVLWPVRAISCVNAGLINESVLRGSAPPDYNRTGTVGSPRLTANIALPSMQSYECLIREKDRICTQLLSRELHVCYLPMFFEICVSSVAKIIY